VRPTTSLLLALLAVLIVAAAPATAREYAVWGGCDGASELLKPVRLQHCTRDVTYSLYVDQVQWAAFGDAQATGIGTAYINPCDVSCTYGVWYPSGSASITLSRPASCGDRRLYTHGLVQLQTAYEGRTTFAEDYPCKLVVRSCPGTLMGGALRAVQQRALTCARARTIARRWAAAAGYRTRRSTRSRVRVGAYRCTRAARAHHQLFVNCTASRDRLVRFRAL
jgi:hypothetical protein